MEVNHLNYWNLKEVCRLCLKTPGRKIGIFEEGQHRQIGYKIRSCLRDLLPKDPGEWIAVAGDYEKRWNFPHCIGSVDSKLVTFQPPRSLGSFYRNYKGTNSIVLLALVDSNYKFMYIDVGCNGRMSDVEFLRQAIQSDKLKLPSQKTLENAEKPSSDPTVDDGVQCDLLGLTTQADHWELVLSMSQHTETFMWCDSCDIVSSVIIYPGDPLPQSICPGCLVKLENNFEFLQMYLKNSRILRNILQKEIRGDASEAQKYIKLLENGMRLRKPTINASSYACCQEDDPRRGSMEEQDEDFDWQPAEALIDLEPQEEIFQIFLQDGPSNTFLPEPDDLTLVHARRASHDNFVETRNKEDNNQENPKSVVTVENTSVNASPTAECSSSTMQEISGTIKQEPEEAEEQEIEMTWLMQSADQEEDALDISKVKTEPVPLSLAVIKQEQSEPAAVSVMNINNADVKEETSTSSTQPRTRSRRINVECSKCFLVFHRELEILRHRCIGVSPWYCKPCNKYYKTKETFSRHKKYSCFSKELTCVACDNVFPNRIQLAHHQMIHLRLKIKQLDVTKLNTCKTCNRTFISKASLNMHERSHLNINERNHYLSGEESKFSHILAIPQSTETHSGLAHSSNRNFVDQQYAKASGKLKNEYHCTVCKAVFTNQKLFITHSRQHSLKNEYKHKKQPMMFKTERNKGQQERLQHAAVKLVVTDKKYSSVDRYACIICRKSFDTQEILVEHKKLHTSTITAFNTRPFSAFTMGNGTVPVSGWVCKICGLDCRESTVLWSHMHEKHSRMSYKCSHCPKTFDKLCSLKSHEKTHEPKLRCTACGKQYSTLKALAAHKQNKHVSPSATHLCRKCNIKFDSRSALLIHARNHQSLPKLKNNFTSVSSKSQSSHACSTCGKTFTRYDSLKRHESIHATGKHTFYPCYFCGLKLVSIPSYKAHTERHFQKMEKTQCPTCKRTYFTQDFSKHFCVRRQHGLNTSQASTVKKFKCELCNAVFATQQARNSHMRIHRKNWKYSTQRMEKNTPTFKKLVHNSGNISYTIYCPLCSKAFLSKGKLQHHVKLHHSKK